MKTIAGKNFQKLLFFEEPGHIFQNPFRQKKAEFSYLLFDKSPTIEIDVTVTTVSRKLFDMHV